MSGIDILTNVMYAAVIVVSLLLICLVLVQPSKSGGMGAAFGGLGQSVFGAQAGSHLTKLTVILTTIFFVLALALAFLVGHKSKQNTELLDQSVVAAAEQESSSAALAQPAAAEVGAALENAPESAK